MKIIQFDDGKYAVMRTKKFWFFKTKNEFVDGDGFWREWDLHTTYTINQYVKLDTLEQAQARRAKVSETFKVIE
jgi:hypothetical protein